LSLKQQLPIIIATNSTATLAIRFLHLQKIIYHSITAFIFHLYPRFISIADYIKLEYCAPEKERGWEEKEKNSDHVKVFLSKLIYLLYNNIICWIKRKKKEGNDRLFYTNSIKIVSFIFECIKFSSHFHTHLFPLRSIFSHLFCPA
jgi:hypothetical protein